MGFIHIMNFILKQLNMIIPKNLPLTGIREQSTELFVADNIKVEKLRFCKPFENAKKYTNIMTEIHFKTLS